VAAHHSLSPPGIHHSLGRLRAGTVEIEEGTACDLEKELRSVGEVSLPKAVEHLHRQAAWIDRRLDHDRRHCAHQYRLGDALGAVPADVARDFASTCRVADHEYVPKFERLHQLGEVVRVLIHVVPVPWLTRATMAAPVVSDAAKTIRSEVEHLRLPGVAA